MLLHRLDGEVVDLPYMADTLDESGNLAERARPSHPSRITADLTMQLTLHLHSLISKITPYSRQCKSFQSNNTFYSSQKPGPSLTSIPEFVVDSHAAYWNPALVGVGCGQN